MKRPKFPDSTRGEDAACAVFLFLLCAPYLLAPPPEGYGAIATWKYGVFLALYTGFILLSAEQRLVSGRKASDRRGRPDAFALCVLAYFLFTCVSGVASPYPGVFFGNARQDGILTAGLYAASTLLLTRKLRPKKWMLYVFGGAVTILCLLGIVQLTGANPFRLYPPGLSFYDGHIAYTGQYWSTVGNVNMCAALLSAAAGAFAAAAIRSRRGADWLCLIPLGLSVFSIVELDSEAGMAALLAGMTLLPPVAAASGCGVRNLLLACSTIALALAAAASLLFFDGGVVFVRSGRSALLLGTAAALALLGLVLGRALEYVSPAALRRGLLTLTLAAAGGGLLFLYWYDGFPEGFLAQAHELLHGHWEDDYGSSRLYIWRQVWTLIRQRPLLGGGPDSLGLRGLTGFSFYNEAAGAVVTTEIDAAHNEYLNIWVNQGGLALAAYVAAVCVSLFRWWRAGDQPAKAIAGAAALFYLIQALFGISSCASTPYLWAALAVINNKTEGNERDETRTKTTGTESGASPHVRRAAGKRAGRRNRDQGGGTDHLHDAQ